MKSILTALFKRSGLHKSIAIILVALIFGAVSYIKDMLPESSQASGAVHISDGDTLTMTSDNETIKVRLFGIDAPELSQPMGQAARRYLESLLDVESSESINVTTYYTDQYGRAVSVLKVGDMNVNERMLEAGYAWYYYQYCDKRFCNAWEDISDTAKAERKGVWQDKNPTPPWEYRRK